MEVISGGGRSSRGHLEVGDQSQVGIPDYKGELCMQKFGSMAEFRGSWLGNYTVYRAINPLIGASIARVMYTAINNPNIGWTNNGTDRLTIYQYGATATEPCGCDCVSLVSFCVAYATGDSSFNNMWLTRIGNQLVASGLFTCLGPAGSFCNDNDKPLCTGDVIVGASYDHTEVIIKGYDRSGSELSIPGQITPIITGSAYSGFVPRMSAPSPNEPAYSQFYSQQYCQTLNASYAWSRFSEICGELCKLSRGPAERWYLCEEDGYRRGQSPNIGAVICFTSKSGSGGLVGIVESVGTQALAVSLVHPSSNTFQVLSVGQVEGIWSISSDYFFQGFIYNPKIAIGITRESKLDSFLKTAKQYIGDTGSFVKSTLNYDAPTKPWSAAFIMAVAKKVGGLLDVIIPDTYSCSSIGSLGVGGGMGSWYNGPTNGGNPYPNAGDIALFRLDGNSGETRYDADKAAIVTSVDPTATGADGSDTSFTYIMGDSAGKVQSKTSTVKTSMLSGIYRPNWRLVDSLAGAAMQGYQINGYYAQGTSSEDAILKDYKYINASKSGSQPSIGNEGWMLCAINHSSLNGNIYSLFANMLTQDVLTNAIMNTSLGVSAFNLLNPELISAVDGAEGSIWMGTSGTCYLNNTSKTIFKTLSSFFNGNAAGAIGFMGCMWAESCFQTSAENFKELNGTKVGYAAGLCQWIPNFTHPEKGRRYKMEQHCLAVNGQEWRNNLSGQLDYIREELGYSGYHPTLDRCTTCSQSLAGALDACKTVLTNFEMGSPKYEDEKILKDWYGVRSSYTEKLWQLFFGNIATSAPTANNATVPVVNANNNGTVTQGRKVKPTITVTGATNIQEGVPTGLSGPYTVNGVKCCIWQPSGGSAGLIVCLPGLGTTYNSNRLYSAFHSVLGGYVQPGYTVFFGFYDFGTNVSVNTLGGVISELRTYGIAPSGGKLGYYGYSQGAWLYWDNGYGSLGFTDVILGDGSWSVYGGPAAYNENRILLFQTAPGGKGVKGNIEKAEQIYAGRNLQIVDLTTIVPDHPVRKHDLGSFYVASNNGITYAGLTGGSGYYYDPLLPEPHYGIPWI